MAYVNNEEKTQSHFIKVWSSPSHWLHLFATNPCSSLWQLLFLFSPHPNEIRNSVVLLCPIAMSVIQSLGKAMANLLRPGGHAFWEPAVAREWMMVTGDHPAARRSSVVLSSVTRKFEWEENRCWKSNSRVGTGNHSWMSCTAPHPPPQKPRSASGIWQILTLSAFDLQPSPL